MNDVPVLNIQISAGFVVILNYFSNYGRSIAIARDLLKSWAAKIEGMELR